MRIHNALQIRRVWESSTSLWIAEAGLAHWTLEGGLWSRAAPAVGIPPHMDDASASSPGVRGLIGRTVNTVFTLYFAASDALGTLRPRIMSYVPATGVFDVIIYSPSVGEPYRGVAFPPACAPVSNGNAQPSPLPSYAPPLPLPVPSVSLTTNVSVILAGQRVGVRVSVTPPDAGDFLGVWVGSSSSTNTTAPLRVINLVDVSGGLGGGATYLSTGSANVTLLLPGGLHGGYKLAVMRSGAGFPVFDNWLGAAPTELPGAIALNSLDLGHPTRLRVTPGDREGELRVSWTSSIALSEPTLQWSAARPSSLGGSMQFSARAGAATTVDINMLCGSFLPELRSIAREEGWVPLGLHYTAVLRWDGSGETAAGQRLYYRVGDAAAVGGTWSSIQSLRVPPLGGGRALASSAAPYSILLIADTGVGTNDDSLAFRNRGSATAGGLVRMASEIDAGNAGTQPPIVGLGHSGDLHYGDGLLGTMADFSTALEPLAASIPFWWAVGNHEAAYGGRGGDFFERPQHSGGECNVPPSVVFPMPRGATPSTPWYWHTIGGVANVHMSTEHNFTRGSAQHSWLTFVLSSLNRTVTPWVLLFAHRPTLVVSSQDPLRTDGHQLVAAMLRDHVLPLATETGVTLFLGGHHHSLQRHCVVVASTAAPAASAVPACAARASSSQVVPLGGGSAAVPAWTYASPPGPVHINLGNGGVEMDDESATALGASTLENGVLLFRHGYAKVTMSPDGTTLDYVAIAFDDGSVLDRVRITQDPVAVAATQARRAVDAGVAQWSSEAMSGAAVGRATPEAPTGTPLPSPADPGPVAAQTSPPLYNQDALLGVFGGGAALLVAFVGVVLFRRSRRRVLTPLGSSWRVQSGHGGGQKQRGVESLPRVVVVNAAGRAQQQRQQQHARPSHSSWWETAEVVQQ